MSWQLLLGAPWLDSIRTNRPLVPSPHPLRVLHQPLVYLDFAQTAPSCLRTGSLLLVHLRLSHSQVVVLPWSLVTTPFLGLIYTAPQVLNFITKIKVQMEILNSFFWPQLMTFLFQHFNQTCFEHINILSASFSFNSSLFSYISIASPGHLFHLSLHLLCSVTFISPSPCSWALPLQIKP